MALWGTGSGARTNRLPHPIPYQGSKRLLAPRILGWVRVSPPRRLLEPFAGSGAITIAAAASLPNTQFVLGDSLPALADIWDQILSRPYQLADDYESIWQAQLLDPAGHFLTVRDRFNRSGGAGALLYLLARCVKNAPRFNLAGAFNQSADHRRLGMRPDKMRAQILGAASLLSHRTTAHCEDFESAIDRACPGDVVYLDPPWGGTTYGSDKRYHQGVGTERVIGALRELDRRGVAYLLSYDGRCGDRSYGHILPDDLQATRIELVAGRSSQATLVGRTEVTVESLYVSRVLYDCRDEAGPSRTGRRAGKPPPPRLATRRIRSWRTPATRE